jgi:ABC-type uncharacterized transport system ATPase subunit
MSESPPSPTVSTTNPVVHVWDADPMAGLTEEEMTNAGKKIAKLLRKEHSITIIVEAKKLYFLNRVTLPSSRHLLKGSRQFEWKTT